MQVSSQNVTAPAQRHTPVINPQLDQMMIKLRAKVQNEVQLRIEN
jgi:hypothetical protein